MAEKTAEQLSALMDGECPAAEMDLALRRLAKQTDLQARWQRYHLISDVLKNNLPNSVDTGFADRIRSTIDETAVEFPVPGKNIVWHKPVVGVAIAASLAAAIALSINFDDQTAADKQTAAVDPIATAANTSAPASASPISAQISLNPAATEANTPTDPKAQLPLPLHLQMMANHLEYASTNSVHGIVPFVSTVSSQASRR